MLNKNVIKTYDSDKKITWYLNVISNNEVVVMECRQELMVYVSSMNCSYLVDRKGMIEILKGEGMIIWVKEKN